MAIIPQRQLFTWEHVEELGDLERLQLVIDNLPDEPVIEALQARRGRGRNDYPIRPMWNALLAGVVLGHASAASLLRELRRNGQLRWLCGFDVFRGLDAAPTDNAFSNFMRTLLEATDLVERMFNEQVEQLCELLPDFGKELALDGKAISSWANRPAKDDKDRADGRSDTDADCGVKKYRCEREDGSFYEKIVKWFGYKLHLIVDSKYELPVARSLTQASVSEMPEAHKLVDALAERHEGLVERCEALTADRGLDDGKLYEKLWDEHGIRPVIDNRHLWRTADKKMLPGHDRVSYDQNGQLHCWDHAGCQYRMMVYAGFEKDRDSHKFRCPAYHYGMHCPSRGSCPVGNQVRVKLSVDRRIFTPVSRCSGKWRQYYNRRTSVERVNGRIDQSFGFEHHTIRGEKKMRLRVDLALTVMLAMAIGRIKQKRPDLARSLVKAA